MWMQREQSLIDSKIEHLQRLIEYQEGIVRTLRIKKYLGLYVDPHQLTEETELLGRLYRKLNGIDVLNKLIYIK